MTDTGRAGLTGVETNNASQMAFARQSGFTSTSLSRDFSYSPDQGMSFIMQAVANPSSGRQAASGVVISFLDLFNQPLGSLTLANGNGPGPRGAIDIPLDQLQHDYTASFGSWAAQSGLGSTDPITKMSLNFFANAAESSAIGVPFSSSKVWFDEVTVSPVPQPAAAWLFSMGLLVVGLKKLSKRIQSD